MQNTECKVQNGERLTLLEQMAKRLPVEDDISDAVTNCVRTAKRLVQKAPAVEAVEVPDKELLKAIKLLIRQYEHSKNSDYVHSPVAHALYHTWRQVDEARMDGDGDG